MTALLFIHKILEWYRWFFTSSLLLVFPSLAQAFRFSGSFVPVNSARLVAHETELPTTRCFNGNKGNIAACGGTPAPVTRNKH